MREARIGKVFTLCKKGSAKEKGRSDPSKNRSKSDLKREKARKDGLHRAKKRGRFLEKVPENGLKTGKSAKNGDFGAKKEGWGRGEKTGFTADFAML